jgi:SAM-dependent methyltransferase
VRSDLAEDVRQHRDWLLSFVPVSEPTAFIDLGCGSGDDLLAVAARSPFPDTRLVGVDAAENSVQTATARAIDDPRIEIKQLRLREHLPFDDASFDVVYSSNLLECLGDKRAFVREVARILRPGQLVIAAHWDWDSQQFDATDKMLVRRLVHAFADWQPDWMEHADGWMGRRLWGVFNCVGLFDGAVYARVLTNTTYAPAYFGHARAQDFHSLVERGLVTSEDYRRLIADQELLSSQGRYFYSITGYVYVGRRVTEHASGVP